MSSTIWVAIISLIGTMIGSLGGVIASNNLVKYRLEELEKKVDKHNNLVERTYKLEQKVDDLMS